MRLLDGRNGLNIQCGSCGAFVAPGGTACGVCGTSLLQPVRQGTNDAACAAHPELRSATTCERCGVFACARCLRGGDTGAALCHSCFERAPQGLLPWDRRAELGIFRAFLQTAWGTISQPKPFFEGARSEGSVGSSVLFVLLASAIAYLPTLVVYVGLVGVQLLVSKTVGGDVRASSGAALFGVLALYVVLVPLFGVGFTLVNAGIDHLVLRGCGEERPFAVTLRGCALSMGPYLFGIIPFCSPYVLPFWVLVVRLYAYRGLHRTTDGRAALGAFVSAALCCFGFVGLLTVAFALDFAGRAAR